MSSKKALAMIFFLCMMKFGWRRRGKQTRIEAVTTGRHILVKGGLVGVASGPPSTTKGNIMEQKKRNARWSQELDAELARLWADPLLSCAAIGEKLGVTKNSVIGRARRLKLKARRSGVWKGKTRKRKKGPVLAKTPLKIVAPPAPQSRPCSLMELTDYSCRFPIGDPDNADFHFCGAITAFDSYCTYHQAIALEVHK